MSVTRGTLAFVGPAHVKKFTEFRYVEVVSVSDDTTTVETVGPDDDLPVETLDVPSIVIGFRAVPDFERHLWPGSYVSHPVAFVRTSTEGVDLWAYGFVSGYTSSVNTSTLHVVSAEGPVRLPLTDPYSAIKVDPLNYALQTGGGVNATSCTPLELLHRQNATVAACNKKKSGIPAAVISPLAIAFDGDAVVSLVKPTSLQLVHVRHQHIVEFVTAARTKRPRDLYNDPSATSNSRPTVSPQGRGVARLGSPGRRDTTGNKPTRSVQVRLTEAGGRESDEFDDVHGAAVDGNSDSGDNEDEDINAVRHMNRSLSSGAALSHLLTRMTSSIYQTLSQHGRTASRFSHRQPTEEFMLQS
ncbi:hypothetical protein V7S43_010584 [Phytophthora oleae]|uniref:Uncharacterized protein n=1 Tax=Phytophthora oleae TaxID=2107226 RepID=A0ABD3FCV1_9STRA